MPACWDGVVSLSFYPTALEPSEIDFPAQSTSEIDLTSFYQIPEHPCYQVPFVLFLSCY